ncbi:TMEM175 family protein [Streptomyces abikoensis]|uniref:TMEM175 family protein n=1 Tax=Streptomyces abikoensis TaxID=97398 RepID=UPI0036C7FD2D
MARDPYVIEMDRMLAFADAVTAIAITLLALEIHVPEGLPDAEVGQAFGHLLPKVLAYLVGFVLVGAIWLGHHKLFRLMATLDRAMVRLEFALLAVIAFLPFTARLMSEHGGAPVAMAVYTGAIGLEAALLAVMALRLRDPGPLRRPEVTRQQVAREVFDNASIAAIATVALLVALAAPLVAVWWWVLIWPARGLPRYWPWLRARI